MPSTRLPPLLIQHPPLSALALEDPDMREKILQGVAMFAYGMLRCALVPLSVQHAQYMSTTQPQRRNVECQFVRQQSNHQNSTHDRHDDSLLCRRPSLAD